MNAPAKSHWRFSLRTLLLTVSGIAVICAVLPYPGMAFYSLIAFFILAAVLARFGPPHSKRFWFWFALCGWVYLLLSVSLLESFESSAQWDSAREWIRKCNLGPSQWAPQHYLLFAHFLVGVCAALLGAILACLLKARYDSDSSKEDSGETPAVVRSQTC